MSPWRRNAVAFHTICTKEVMRFRCIWVQTPLPAAVTPGLPSLPSPTLRTLGQGPWLAALPLRWLR